MYLKDMIIITFIVVVMFSFVVVVVVGPNTYAQSDKFKERQQENEVLPLTVTEAVNMTDEMKYRCIQIDASGSIDQIKDKEQKVQCEKFLDRVSIFEMRELIDKYLVAEDN